MLKKIVPVFLAALTFFAALFLLRPAPSQTVVVATADLRAGQVLTEADLALKPLPQDVVAADALTDITQAIGQTLRIDRGQGDVICASQLGEMIALQPNERAIAVQITDPSGVAGMLLPGQQVGVIAMLDRQSLEGQGTFSKAVLEGLGVMYVDPRFAADAGSSQTVSTPTGSSNLLASSNLSEDRAKEGTVILAVPTDLTTILYDFSAEGSISESRLVNALELLAALNTTEGARLSLYLMPSRNVEGFSSPGLWLPDLVVTPQPTPTPTLTPTPAAGG